MNLIRIEVDNIDLRFRYRDEWWSDDCSQLRVCPWCERPWAKITMQHPYHLPFGASCEQCPPWRPADPYLALHPLAALSPDIPGSLFETSQFKIDRTDSLIDYLPLPLLMREARVHFAAIDKGRPFMLSPEDSNALQLYRERINAGEIMSPEDTKAAIALLRADRQSAAARANASRAKGGKAKAPKAPPASASDLLAKLGIKVPGASK